MPPPAPGSAAGVTGRPTAASGGTEERASPPPDASRRMRLGPCRDEGVEATSWTAHRPPVRPSTYSWVRRQGRSARVVGDLGRSTVVDTAAIIRQKGGETNAGHPARSAGRMSSGGTPASASTLLGRTSQALRVAGDPAAAVGLWDGVTVHLRPVRAEDAAAIRCLFQGLSETSTWLRFFTVCPSLDRVVDWATEVDNDRRLGVVAIAADTGQLIAPRRPGTRPPPARSGGIRRGGRRPLPGARAGQAAARPARRGGPAGWDSVVDRRGAGQQPPDAAPASPLGMDLQAPPELWGCAGGAVDLVLPRHRHDPSRLKTAAPRPGRPARSSSRCRHLLHHRRPRRPRRCSVALADAAGRGQAVGALEFPAGPGAQLRRSRLVRRRLACVPAEGGRSPRRR